MSTASKRKKAADKRTAAAPTPQRHWQQFDLGKGPNPKNPTRPTLAEMIERCDYYESLYQKWKAKYDETIDGRLENIADKLDQLTELVDGIDDRVR